MRFQMDKNKNSSNQTVVKLLQLITCLSEANAPMKLQDVSQAIGVPQATTFRYLNALIEEGFAFQDEISSRYAMTWKISELGNLVRNNMRIRTLIGNSVNDLSIRLSLGVSLVIEKDMECIYLDCAYEPNVMGKTLQRIGLQAPIHAVSSGKLFLTEYSETDVDRLIAEKGLSKLTDKTITTKEKLLIELKKTRENGYALDDEECEEGLRCVAVPIYDYNKKIVAALSSFGDVGKLSFERIQSEILPELRKLAESLSFKMGYKA